jgi:hypothetical protein
MHERLKLAEARYFLDRMAAQHADRTAFARELSAFLAAARSVLQHARDEARAKPGGQSWYDQAMTNALFAFFKDLRDNSIHAAPVTPVTKFKTIDAQFLNFGDDDDEIMIPYPHTTTVQHYEFQSRPGEEVEDLSRHYLMALEGFVEDGVATGWITG